MTNKKVQYLNVIKYEVVTHERQEASSKNPLELH